MATLRSVNTEFWADEYIEDLSRDGKFLFLYLLTNPQTNIAGAYKISRKKIKQDTDFTDDELSLLLTQFERDGKVIYRDGWMFLPNFLKNQSLGGNLPKTAINLALETPDWIQSVIAETIKESPKLAAVFASVKDLVLCLKTKSLCDRTRSANRKEEKGSESENEGKREAALPPPPTRPFGEPSKFDHPAVVLFEEAFQFKVGSNFATAVSEKIVELEVWRELLQNKRAFADKSLDERKKVCNWILDEYDKRVEKKQNGSPERPLTAAERNWERTVANERLGEDLRSGKLDHVLDELHRRDPLYRHEVLPPSESPAAITGGSGDYGEGLDGLSEADHTGTPAS